MPPYSLILTLVLWLLTLGPAISQPRHLYLTWEDEDTAHTQTVVFQTLDRASDPRVEIVMSAGAEPTVIRSQTVMFSGLSRRIHWVNLRELAANTVYKFRAGDNRYGMSAWRTFRTLPDDDTPIKIVTGGDMYRHDTTVQLLEAASQHVPDVALVGGDIAYADGRLNRLGFWDDWFDNWEDHLNGENGRIVPMICAIGNHEVNGAFGQPRGNAPFYFAFFPQGGAPYFTRKLGSEIDLVVLDTGHVTPHREQVPFLERALQKSEARFKVALYHVPCYPTHRSFRDYYSTQGREHWVPLFDKYGLDLALENHDHVFKRTHPLKNGKIDEDGTVYLGEGCWGRTPRTVADSRWYHVKALPKRHVWLIQNQEGGLFCQAVDRFGTVFDQTTVR